MYFIKPWAKKEVSKCLLCKQFSTMSTQYGLCAHTDMEVKPHRSLCCGWGQCEAITKYWVTEQRHGVFLKNEPISVGRNTVWFCKHDHHLSIHAYVLFMFTAHHDAIVLTASISLWRGAGTPRLAVPHQPVTLDLEQSILCSLCRPLYSNPQNQN